MRQTKLRTNTETTIETNIQNFTLSISLFILVLCLEAKIGILFLTCNTSNVVFRP